MQIIRARDKPLTPWKNGGGLTREIAVHVDKRFHDDFLWRISQAVVDTPGEFSRFDGIDRTLAVLDGQGIVLKSDHGEMMVDRGSQPYCFAGELEIQADLIGGATTDLNVMTRRGFFKHDMTEITFYDHEIIEVMEDTTFIICNSDMVINGQQLSRFDAVTGFAKGDDVELEAQGKGQIFVINLIAC